MRRFYVVHPVPGLRSLAERIVEHWRSGYGSRYNPSRHEASTGFTLRNNTSSGSFDLSNVDGPVTGDDLTG